MSKSMERPSEMSVVLEGEVSCTLFGAWQAHGGT